VPADKASAGKLIATASPLSPAHLQGRALRVSAWAGRHRAGSRAEAAWPGVSGDAAGWAW